MFVTETIKAHLWMHACCRFKS